MPGFGRAFFCPDRLHAVSPSFPCLRTSGTFCVLDLSAVPGAKRTEVVGLHDGALRLRLAAPPVDGKANDEIVAWLAQSLGLPRRDVQLLRGLTSRRKQIQIDAPEAVVAAWLGGLGLA
ncbi:DUF167 domain-containing protein [Ideonella paludis]|uniref:UPF0235 protein KAK11_09250 n=1 Tax=Ideonella paludis TaxID=1233411 RepID=A0ABS5DXE2_9BURK|nr:DUF167 domain-containing protein [Ideonella paludis]